MSTNTFVHIGDVHLQCGHPRNEDRLQALNEIIDETHTECVSAYLIPGDLFHMKSTAADRNLLADRLQDLSAHAPVVLVRGNHDAIGDLDIFARLKSRWPVYVVTRPQVLQVPLPTGDTAAIACLPYPDKGGLVVQGVAPGETSQTGLELLDAIFMQFAHELSTLRVSGCIPLFVGHVNVRGSISSTGQPQVGTEVEIDVGHLARLPVVYCGLSHIHRPQEIGRGVYAGSIARLDFGEVEEKSYVVVTCEPDASGWTAVYERRPLDVPPMFHIDSRLDRHGFSVDSMDESHDEEIHRRLAAKDWAGTDVRVRFRFRASERSILDPETTIRPLFAGALRLKIEGIAEPDRDLRAPEVAAAATLEQKLAVYRKVEQLPPSLVEKLAMLEQHELEHVLAHVATLVKAVEFPATTEKATVAA